MFRTDSLSLNSFNDVEFPSWLDGGNTVLPTESVSDAASGAAADTLVSSVHHLNDHIMV